MAEIEAHARRLKAALDSQLAERSAEVASLTAEVGRAREREDGLNARVTALQRQEQEAREHGLALHLLLSELRSVYRVSVSEAEQLLSGHKRMKRQLGRRAKEVGDLRRRLSDQRQELAAVRRSLDGILRSASWRATSPYRRLRGWLA